MRKHISPCADAKVEREDGTQSMSTFQMNDVTPSKSIETSRDVILQHVKAVDLSFFAEHPETEVYVREMVPGEFEAERLPCASPPPGQRFAVRVVAFRDPIARDVIMRLRFFELVPRGLPLPWRPALLPAARNRRPQ